MESPTAVWVPSDFQMSNYWTMEPAVWAPSLPVEYQYPAAEIFGSCLQISSGGQLAEYAQSTQNPPIQEAAAQEFEVDFYDTEAKIHHDNTICAFEEASLEFKVDMDMMRMKIHRYPPSLRDFEGWNSVPRMVAMGPYHHARVLPDHLKKVEKAKHVAAYHCVRESGHSLQEVYDAVVAAADDALRLYDKDVMAGIGYDDFRHMMFFDACFLVQYMLWCTHAEAEMEASLRSFFEFNRKVLRHDLMLLENQLPWQVVVTVMRFRPVNLVDFISDWRNYLQDRKVLEKKPVVLDDGYQPPHLLGLLRFYIVGRSNTKLHTRAKHDLISGSVSALELAEIGITLTASKETTEIIQMGVNNRGILSAELSLAPLSLDDERASFLINMAALELCTTSNFLAAEDEDSAVCSYLLLLSMLVHREEDVQELRTKHLLHGGAGLVNKDALVFFTSLQSLPLRGSCYVRVIVEIEKYKVSRRMRTKVHAFLYKNKKTIFTVFSVVSVLVSILGTLLSLKSRSKL